jgi:hypothetical protein
MLEGVRVRPGLHVCWEDDPCEHRGEDRADTPVCGAVRTDRRWRRMAEELSCTQRMGARSASPCRQVGIDGRGRGNGLGRPVAPHSLPPRSVTPTGAAERIDAACPRTQPVRVGAVTPELWPGPQRLANGLHPDKEDPQALAPLVSALVLVGGCVGTQTMQTVDPIVRFAHAVAIPLPDGLRAPAMGGVAVPWFACLAVLAISTWLLNARCLAVSPGLVERKYYPFGGSHIVLTREGRRWFWSTAGTGDRRLWWYRTLVRTSSSMIPSAFVFMGVAGMAVAAGGRYCALPPDAALAQRAPIETRIALVVVMGLAWRLLVEMVLRHHALAQNSATRPRPVFGSEWLARQMWAYWDTWFPRSLLVTGSWASCLALLSLALLIVAKVSWR